MALTFGSVLDDVSGDTDALEEMLSGPAPDSGGPELEADPDPGWDEPAPTLAGRLGAAAKARTPKPVRVTAALKKDVQGKTAFLLAMGASAWQARDEPCGGAMLEAVPDVSAALADIFCDSPDIVKWFSAGSGYMKWLNLAVALQPVAQTVFRHHVSHTLDTGDGAEQDWSGYAAA